MITLNRHPTIYLMTTWWQHGSFNTIKNAVLHCFHKKAHPYWEFFCNGSSHTIFNKNHILMIYYMIYLLISAGKHIHTCFIFSPHMLPLTSITKTMFFERGVRSDGAKKWMKWPSDTWEIENRLHQQWHLMK